MVKRKELKKNARQSLKKHWITFVFVCIIGMLLSGEALFTRLTASTGGSAGTISFMASREQNAESIETESADTSTEDADSDGFHIFLNGLDTDDASSALTVRDLDNLLESVVNAQNNDSGSEYRRGVLSGIMTRVSSGSFFPTLATSFTSILKVHTVKAVFSVLFTTLLAFLFWFLVKNLYCVISARMFLEGRQYEKVRMYRLTYIFRSGHWLKAATTLLVKEIFHTLWCLTIIGGFIKYYSYFLVPYIVAENPDIDTLEAITLSRKMMKGHKWQCFIMQMSFIGWEFLNVFTFNILSLLYVRPYEQATECEFYAAVRGEAKQNQPEITAVLNDTYLYTLADDEILAEAYADAISAYDTTENTADNVQLKGIEYILANFFGIALRDTEAVHAFEKQQIAKQNNFYRREAYEKKVYPSRLNKPLHTGRQAGGVHLNPYRIYSIWSILLIFFFMSLVGWIWEVSLHVITDGTFVNRGVLQGPWLPIYGTGSVLVLILLYRLRRDPIKEFFATIVVCGVVEYFTAYYLELTHDGTRWWDYTGYFLNLHGRICAEGLITFGIGGMIIVYMIAPILDALLRRVGNRRLMVVALILLALYVVDNSYSAKHPNTGEGITDYTSEITDIDNIVATETDPVLSGLSAADYVI